MMYFIFGLYLSPLFSSIAMVESGNGFFSENVYQITSIYVDDLNRIYPEMRFKKKDVLNKETSRLMMYLYWKHYAYQYAKETGRAITCEVLSKMHHCGGRYWTRDDTGTVLKCEKYWSKINKMLLK